MHAKCLALMPGTGSCSLFATCWVGYSNQAAVQAEVGKASWRQVECLECILRNLKFSPQNCKQGGGAIGGMTQSKTCLKKGGAGTGALSKTQAKAGEWFEQPPMGNHMRCQWERQTRDGQLYLGTGRFCFCRWSKELEVKEGGKEEAPRRYGPQTHTMYVSRQSV